jgi:enoyl-CoA hydratase/carnithine racemase
MRHESTLTLARPTPRIARIAFANRPVNLIVAEIVSRMGAILQQLDDDPDLQVIVFASGLPAFFNQFDLAVVATGSPSLSPCATPSRDSPKIPSHSSRLWARSRGGS